MSTSRQRKRKRTCSRDLPEVTWLLTKIAVSQNNGKYSKAIFDFVDADYNYYRSMVGSFGKLHIPPSDLGLKVIQKIYNLKQPKTFDDFCKYAYENSKQRRPTSTTIPRFYLFQNKTRQEKTNTKSHLYKNKSTYKSMNRNKFNNNRLPQLQPVPQLQPLPPLQPYVKPVITNTKLPSFTNENKKNKSHTNYTNNINSHFDVYPTHINTKRIHNRSIRTLHHVKEKNKHTSNSNKTNKNAFPIKNNDYQNRNRLRTNKMQNVNGECSIQSKPHSDTNHHKRKRADTTHTDIIIIDDTSSITSDSTDLFRSPYYAKPSPSISESNTSQLSSLSLCNDCNDKTSIKYKLDYLIKHCICLKKHDLIKLRDESINRLYVEIYGRKCDEPNINAINTDEDNNEDDDLTICVKTIADCESSTSHMIGILQESGVGEYLCKNGYAEETNSFMKGLPIKKRKRYDGSSENSYSLYD